MKPIGAEKTVGGLAVTSTVFAELANWLRTQSGVVSVDNPLRISGGPMADRDAGKSTMRVEWYTDAEFANGRALSFGLELRLVGREWEIEPGVRIVDDQGEADLLDLPMRHAVDDTEMCDDLTRAARDLASLRLEGLAAFDAWPL